MKNIGHHAHLRGNDHRTCFTTGLPVTGNSHFERRKEGYFCTFNDFNTFAQLSFSSLPQISSSFSSPCLSNTPILLACKERQGKWPLYSVANYVLFCAVQDAQCNTEESS